MSLLFNLFVEFFKIGLFAIGGGLATIPFLEQLTVKYTWFSMATLVDMIAISESTPGAMGVNMATYTGFTTAGIPGALIATFGLVLPSIIVIIIIAQFLKQFRNSPVVSSLFAALKPAVAALILGSALSLITVSVINLDAFRQSGQLLDLFPLKNLCLFAILVILTTRIKKHPIVWIALSALIGILFRF